MLGSNELMNSRVSGSEEMLAVVTEATLKLLPLPPFRASLAMGFGSMREAAGAVKKIFAAGFLPAGMTNQTRRSNRRFRASGSRTPRTLASIAELDFRRPAKRRCRVVVGK